MGFHLIPKEYYSGLSLGDEIAMGTYHVKQDGKKMIPIKSSSCFYPIQM